jgi:prepilin-type N-terminal cleavage/methylation domain-containing protein
MSVRVRHMMKLHQRGDTIVEVLIAITIVSLILGGAYVTSHNSLDATLDAQEHDNALQLAQAQIELLRSDATTGNSIFSTPVGPSAFFCIQSDGTLETTQSACTVNGIGTTSGSNNGPVIYFVRFIERTGSAPGPYTFTIQTSWPGLENKTDDVQLIYRVYE